MISHNRSKSGKSGAPSYMTPVAPLASGAVDDVRMAGDPADVGGAPVDVVRLEVEDVLMGRGRPR